jgi:hypothetical protein
MGRDTAYGRGAVDEREPVQDTVPEWWAHADEFPRWYVWRGVTGLYYARIPGISPQRVVHARTPEGLAGVIIDAKLSWQAALFAPRQRVACV